MTLLDLIDVLGEEIQDPDEGDHDLWSDDWDLLIQALETFLLFSAATFSQNLGFIDPKADALQITVADREMTIEQSPSLLSSDRKGGTTGAGRQAISMKIFSRTHLKMIFDISCLENHTHFCEMDCITWQCALQNIRD